MAKYLGLAISTALLLQSCKQQKMYCGSEPKIVSGTVVKNSGAEPEIPSIVALLSSSGQGGCTGVLVGEREVLTAAHCVVGMGQGGYVAFGQSQSQSQKIRIASAHAHPSYRKGARTNDVGVILLSASAPVGFRPTAVASSNFELLSQDNILIAGYGESNYGVNDGIVKKTTIPFMSASSGILTLNALNGTGACRGDSGGPAYFKAGDKTILVGLTQGGANNCGREYNFYSDVRSHIPWLEATLGKVLLKSSKRDGSDIPNFETTSSNSTARASATTSNKGASSDPSICRI